MPSMDSRRKGDGKPVSGLSPHETGFDMEMFRSLPSISRKRKFAHRGGLREPDIETPGGRRRGLKSLFHRRLLDLSKSAASLYFISSMEFVLRHVRKYACFSFVRESVSPLAQSSAPENSGEVPSGKCMACCGNETGFPYSGMLTFCAISFPYPVSGDRGIFIPGFCFKI